MQGSSHCSGRNCPTTWPSSLPTLTDKPGRIRPGTVLEESGPGPYKAYLQLAPPSSDKR